MDGVAGREIGRIQYCVTFYGKSFCSVSGKKKVRSILFNGIGYFCCDWRNLKRILGLELFMTGGVEKWNGEKFGLM